MQEFEPAAQMTTSAPTPHDLQEQRFRERRAFKRVASSCPCRVITPAADVYCEILNISLRGIQISSPTPLSPGNPVSVELENLVHLPGTVVWSDGSRHGIELDRPYEEVWRYIGHCWQPSTTVGDQGLLPLSNPDLRR